MQAPLTNILITMAGNGERFRRAGYTQPKFKIEVRGHSLFYWSMLSLRDFFQPAVEVIFACRPDHRPDEFISREAAALGIRNPRIVHIPHPTDGQATTALLAGRRLSNPDSPVLIYNIDTYVEPGHLSPQQARGNGWIPCFPGSGDAWSFARCDERGLVSETAEKRRISPHSTVGLYWFRSFCLFEECYRLHFARNGSEAGERYIAPMYNTLISKHGEVYLTLIPAEAVHPLGTPEDVEAFRR
jgi:hypothetical protein